MPAPRAALVEALARALPAERTPSPIDTNLDTALITAPDARDPAMLAKLDAVCRRVLNPRNQSDSRTNYPAHPE